MAKENGDRYPVTRWVNAADDAEAMEKPVVQRAADRWRAAARRPDGPWYARFRGWRTWTVVGAIVAGGAFAVIEAKRLVLSTGTESVRLWEFFDPGIALATLITTVLVWWSERKEHWLASIEKRLTIICVDATTGNVVLHCDLAPLVHEGDVRALAISLAAQMCRNRKQQFQPDYVAETPRVVRVCADYGSALKWVREYRITLRLKFDEMEEFDAVRKWVQEPAPRKRPYIVWSDPGFVNADGEMPAMRPKGAKPTADTVDKLTPANGTQPPAARAPTSGAPG